MKKNKGRFQKGFTPWMKGRHHTEETKEKIRQKNSGKTHPCYGRKENKNSNWHGGVSEHYMYRMFEEFWHEEVPKGYCIHHIDRNVRNNEISNLALITRRFHAKIHKVHFNLPHIQEAGVEVEE